MWNRTRYLCGIAALALAVAPADIAHAAAAQDVALKGARLDMLPDGRAVVSFESSGAIRGLLTLQIERDGDAVRGQWVLVSRFLQDLTPEGEVDERAQEIRASLPGDELHLLHREYVRIVNRGSLFGSIDGGALDFDVDGRLRSVAGLALTIKGGSEEFAGRTGAASLDAANLHDATRGTGTLRLAPPAAPAAAAADEVTR
jgi:hypothetical protein